MKLLKIKEKLKEMVKVKTIYISLRPIIIMCNLFGVIPFKIEKSSNKYKLTYCCILVLIVNMIAFIVSYGFSVTSRQNIVTSYFDTIIPSVASITFLTGYTVSMIVIYASVVFRRKFLMQTIDQIYQVDVKLKFINAEVNYRKLFLYSVKLIIANTTKFVIFITFNISFQIFSNNVQALQSLISYLYPHLIMSVVVVKYVCVVVNIRERFYKLNEVI